MGKLAAISFVVGFYTIDGLVGLLKLLLLIARGIGHG